MGARPWTAERLLEGRFTAVRRYLPHPHSNRWSSYLARAGCAKVFAVDPGQMHSSMGGYPAVTHLQVGSDCVCGYLILSAKLRAYVCVCVCLFVRVFVCMLIYFSVRFLVVDMKDICKTI